MAMERTFSIIKPDATARNLTGAINALIEKAGLRIVAQKRICMTREQAETFYAVQPIPGSKGRDPYFHPDKWNRFYVKLETPPDAIFVGGTGHEVGRLLESAYQALRPEGKLVVNVATLESLSATYAALKAMAGPVHVQLISVARGTEQLETLRFEAVNPTFLLAVRKPS